MSLPFYTVHPLPYLLVRTAVLIWENHKNPRMSAHCQLALVTSPEAAWHRRLRSAIPFVVDVCLNSMTRLKVGVHGHQWVTVKEAHFGIAVMTIADTSVECDHVKGDVLV